MTNLALKQTFRNYGLLLFVFISITVQARSVTLPTSLSEAQDQAVKLTQDLVRIDTSNPPGQEILATNLLIPIFEKANINFNVYESAPTRANLIARLKGDGSKKPILLLSHLDVVGIEKEHWTKNPFGGDIVDGRLYGRGSSDMKDLTAIETEALLLLKNSGKTLHRDVVLVAVSDEESGGQFGMKWLIENHWPEIASEFAFNEGSRGKPYFKNGKVQWASLQVTEKRSANIRVVAHGKSGHSMFQVPDNAIFTLSKALAKISSYKPKIKLNPAIQRYFDGMAKLEHTPKNWYLKESAGDSDDSRGIYSMIHSTLNATIIKGGFRSNVIPTEAEATINIRLLPNVDLKDIISNLKILVNDSRVTFEADEDKPQVPISDMDSDATRAFEKVIHANFGLSVPYIPTVGAGATDSRYLRAKGVSAYALEPYDDSPQNQHGNDESISVEGLRNAVKLYYEILLELCT
jgi:acetylornithine deacetylase/succinyl-diaminopimelate desuccinylase-like protein